MCRTIVFWFLFSLTLAVSLCHAEDPILESVDSILQQHCVRCHGLNGEASGEVNLIRVVETHRDANQNDLLEKIIKVVSQGEMPPEDESQLKTEEQGVLLTELSKVLERSAQQRVGRTPVRRMNRFQYNNTVKDLFQLDVDVFSLPERMMREYGDYFQPSKGVVPATVKVGSRPLGKSQLIEPRLDGVAPFPQDLRAEHGFDNRGDHLTLSPLLMESFLKLGQSITQSPDFTSQHVGIWEDFFAVPEPLEAVDVRQTIQKRLERFLELAFRRPTEQTTVDRYTAFVIAQLGMHGDFTQAMKAVAAATISSPKFLYLYDTSVESAGVESIDAFELASRLSFFLWGSGPDSKLLELAANGTLIDTVILSEQVDRMLADRKLKRFCDSFPAQWLQLERIISANPNPERYPSFYLAKYRKSMHMMIEPLLLFETVLVENRPITQLIDADFTYRSQVLREAYGEELSGEQNAKGRSNEVVQLTFERQPVTDRRQGGVITNAAVMTMTSGPDRTQPITRGAWLLTVIFNDPPKPPPANVPPLAEAPVGDEQQMTLRERLTLHRERSDCRGCHEKIDPLGFALENYNPVGVWRDNYENGREIDVRDELFRKHKFSNVIEFKDALLSEKGRFSEGFARHLLSFALARELDSSDAVAVAKIAKATAADGYRIQTLIKQVVLSSPFQTKMNANF